VKVFLDLITFALLNGKFYMDLLVVKERILINGTSKNGCRSTTLRVWGINEYLGSSASLGPNTQCASGSRIFLCSAERVGA
jgi:hypothetical protein